jgi:hypothetical protein
VTGVTRNNRETLGSDVFFAVRTDVVRTIAVLGGVGGEEKETQCLGL